MRATVSPLLLLLPVVIVLAVSCTTIPSIPTAPGAGQTAAAGDADAKACAEAATPPRELSYAACMVARRYVVTVTIPAAPEVAGLGGLINLNIASVATSTTEKVRTDLKACGVERLATTWDTLTVAAPIGTTAWIQNRERDYITCLNGRGYTAARWESQ